MEGEEGKPNPIISSSSATDQTLGARKSLRCIVKLGGAAITCKDKLESINEKTLRSVCAQLRQAMTPSKSPSPARVLGMDWSSHLENPIDSTIDEFREQQALDLDNNFIIVHGAGSFGHFQASRSGVHKGGLNLPLVKAGFVATRISVTSLNLEIVRGLARDTLSQLGCDISCHATPSIYGRGKAVWYLLEPFRLPKDIYPSSFNGLTEVPFTVAEGIPSVGMSPFACGWSTCQRNIASADASPIIKALEAGFVPILHGDAVLDHFQDCTILSGDVIIRHLAQLLMPEYVVFLTDVLGVYDRPPTDPNAMLLREIEVNEDGSWSIVKPKLLDAKKEVEITVAAHDTTGGMETKISEAAMIAKLGIPVYITQAGTDHSLRALKGEIHSSPDDWLGTVIHSRQISSSK